MYWFILLYPLLIYLWGTDTIIEESTNIVTEGSTGHEGSNRFFIWKKSVPLIADYFLLGLEPDTLKYVFPADEKE
jgi:hypothetical protein